MRKQRRRNSPCWCGSGKKQKKCHGTSSDASKEITSPLIQEMDRLQDEFDSDPMAIFNDERDRKKFIYDNLIRKMDDWEKSRVCSFVNCLDSSIPRSHTIQKSGPLFKIAENGHVMSVFPDFFSPSFPVVKKIGLRDASTFPGFCVKHEQIFNSFEKSKTFNIDWDYTLQLYRTVCREIVVKRFQIEFRQALADRLQSKAEKWMMKKLEEFTRLHYSSNIRPKEVIIKGGHRLGVLEKDIEDLRQDLQVFEKNFFKPLAMAIDSSDAIDSSKKKAKLEVLIMKVGFDLPFALAGRGKFEFRRTESSTKRGEVILVANVLPTEVGTSFILLYRAEEKEKVMQYVANFFRSKLGALSALESWMVYGSDHWFITPSVWHSFSDGKRNKILSEIPDLRFNVAQGLIYSVFDDTRKGLIADLEQELCNLKGRDLEEARSILSREKEKLGYFEK